VLQRASNHVAETKRARDKRDEMAELRAEARGHLIKYIRKLEAGGERTDDDVLAPAPETPEILKLYLRMAESSEFREA
jgi:hypothetical protein